MKGYQNGDFYPYTYESKNASGIVKWGVVNVSRILKNATYKGYIGYNKSHSNNYLEQKRIANHNEKTYTYVSG
ncbi:MAG: recombinase family protein [Oscillospiraceae bacterium]